MCMYRPYVPESFIFGVSSERSVSTRCFTPSCSCTAHLARRVQRRQRRGCPADENKEVGSQ